MPFQLRRTSVLLLGVVHLTGCATWVTLPSGNAADVFARQEQRANAVARAPRREVFRITQRGGEQVVVTNPTVRADSLVDARVAIALSDIERVEDRRFSAGRTLALIASPFLVIGSVIVIGAATSACGQLVCGS